MRHFKLIIVLLILASGVYGQEKSAIQRPKLVVGLVVDQMRWDYLYRYADVYGPDGFRRLQKEGFSCEQTMINYLPSYTAPGHSSIYTGSVPSIHGIAGNDWIDNNTGKHVYCTEDHTVHVVGNGDPAAFMQSPRNLLTTTITDELRLATNKLSRVYGIALKDRSSILPAGHLANAAFWYDDNTGEFCSSSYYPNAYPGWLKTFNKWHMADSLVRKNWGLLMSAGKYCQSLPDTNKYERCFRCERLPVFPHIFDSLSGKGMYGTLRALPAGNTLTFKAAEACIAGERLGKGNATDFLCVSLSSTDYAGHQFGPNSIEVEDMYLRLDREIAGFLQYLDAKVGKGNYLLFLTADHGAAHNPAYMQDECVPAGFFAGGIVQEMNEHIKASFGKDSIVRAFLNYQFFLNEQGIADGHLDREKVKEYIVSLLNKKAEVSYAVDMEHMDNANVPEQIKAMIVNGYNHQRSGCIQIVLNPEWYESIGSAMGTTHGSWNPYDTHIPLIWYGWHVSHGATNREVNMTDISATLAAMLHIQMPNGCIGKVITEIVK